MVNSAEAAFLEDVRDRKVLLSSILAIVRFMEGLQEGLEAVKVLGEDPDNLPRSATQFLDGLDHRLVNESTSKLRVYLVKIENLVAQDLQGMLKLATEEVSAAVAGATKIPPKQAADVSELVDEFRRRAQTLVSLRILLRKRGESIGAAVIPAQEGELTAALEKLDDKKCEQAERALKEATALKVDTVKQLANPSLSDSMREHLQQMVDSLNQNIEHLRAGKPVRDLPVPMESSEAEDLGWLSPSVRVDHDLPMDPPPEAEGEPGESTASENPDQERSDQPHGFLRTLWIYCTTGPEIGWARSQYYLKKEQE